jgi:hypothetical protein
MEGILDICSRLAGAPIVYREGTRELMRMYIAKGGTASAYNVILQGHTFGVQKDGRITGDRSGHIERLLRVVSSETPDQATALDILQEILSLMRSAREAVGRVVPVSEKPADPVRFLGQFPRFKPEIGNRLNEMLEANPRVKMVPRHDLSPDGRLQRLLQDHRLLLLHDAGTQVIAQEVADAETFLQVAGGVGYYLAVPKDVDGLFDDFYAVATGNA